MEPKSVKGLMLIVERAETLADRIQALNFSNIDVHIPDVPLPLSLESTEAWLEVATDCCRSPLLARSRQLLEAKGINAASVPGSVLEQVESISALMRQVDGLHRGLQPAVLKAIGGALTKCVEDGEAVIVTFAEASRELRTLTGAPEWVVALTAARVAEMPSDSKKVVALAKQVLAHYQGAARAAVRIDPFPSLEKALGDLSNLNKRIQDHEKLLISEGVAHERASVEGLPVEDAIRKLTGADIAITSEKDKLSRDLAEVRVQLRLIGVEDNESPTGLSGLRKLVPRLQNSLEEKRRVLRTSLGDKVFEVVECLTRGRLPESDKVPNDELGDSIRKAVASGYRIQLEAPRENQ